jgi:YfiH family protein
MIAQEFISSLSLDCNIQFWGADVPGSSGVYLHDRGEYNIVNQNIAALKKATGYEQIALMNQKHTNLVKHVNIDNCINVDVECDAQVTSVQGIALMIQTADCVPILLIDQVHSVIGVAHAGWRGAFGGVIENVTLEMQKLGAIDIQAIIGPCIRQSSYEVDRVFHDQFCAQNEMNHAYFKKIAASDNKFLFDLPGYAKRKLLDAGVVKIFDCNINTYNDPRFYSFRRFTHIGGAYGSNISLISLKS